MYSALHHIKTLMFGAVIYYNGSKFGCWRFPAVPFPLRAGSLDGLWDALVDAPASNVKDKDIEGYSQKWRFL